MVDTRKRKRGIVSYREPSSDEDILETDAETHVPKKRNSPMRRSNRNRSPEPRHRNGEASEGTAIRTNARQGLRQPQKRAVTYKDVSSDDDGDEDFEEEEEIEEVEVPRRPQRATAPSRTSRKSVKSRRKEAKPAGSRARQSVGSPLKSNTSVEKPAVASIEIPTDGHIPNWASLPYHVLLQTFIYASEPLHKNMVALPAIHWLLDVARLCKTFTKPALAALYRCPPVHAVKLNQLLVQRLITPSTDAYMNHQVMAKRLELDPHQMSSSTDPLNDPAILSTLVSALTTLKEIDIFDPQDRPPYRELHRRVRRWYYPDELFVALRQSPSLLQSWRWNSQYCTKGPLWIKEIHSDKAFQSLRELILTKFDIDPKKVDDAPLAEELLGSAIAALPNLTSLTFESCKVLNGQLLALLPSSLLSLNITNCINIFSEDLHAFLADHGHKLEELILNHNQCLSLSFLVDLKRFCPSLKVLKVDLNYYSSLLMSADNEPLYDWLLEVDEIPTWPSTLETIELEYLRHWSSDAATNFFLSLINAAGDLPQLRVLKLTAMVDIGWRQRAEYRKKWATWFDHVFADKSSHPSSHLVSLRAYREWKASQNEDIGRNDSLLDISDGVHKSDDVKAQADQAGDDNESDSDAPLLFKRAQKLGEKWSGRRLRTRARTPANYDENSGSEAESNDGSVVSADAEGMPEIVQGRCHTVLFRIDNSRPREEVFGEGDFLDDEPTGDEDWNGDDVVNDGYAW